MSRAVPSTRVLAYSSSMKLELYFFRAMHFSVKRGFAIACRLSVCQSVTLVDCDHISWNSSEIISPLVILRCSHSADPNIRGTSGNFGTK